MEPKETKPQRMKKHQIKRKEKKEICNGILTSKDFYSCHQNLGIFPMPVLSSIYKGYLCLYLEFSSPVRYLLSTFLLLIFSLSSFLGFIFSYYRIFCYWVKFLYYEHCCWLGKQTWFFLCLIFETKSELSFNPNELCSPLLTSLISNWII